MAAMDIVHHWFGGIGCNVIMKLLREMVKLIKAKLLIKISDHINENLRHSPWISYKA
jgi:hypothetical protein